MESVIVLAVVISIIISFVTLFIVFAINVTNKNKFTGIKDNAEYYQLRKEDDPDCRSYTGLSY